MKQNNSSLSRRSFIKNSSMLVGGVVVGSSASAGEVYTVVAKKENNKKDPANVIITDSGRLIFSKLRDNGNIIICDKIIFGYKPYRSDFPNENENINDDEIVYRADVTEQARINDNSVIFTAILSNNIGGFVFNWVGLYSTKYDVIVAVNYPDVTVKTINAGVLIQSIILDYKGLAKITNITNDPKSWQFNTAKRIDQIDYNLSQMVIDQNGKDWFVDDSFLVTKNEESVKIKSGSVYLDGMRIKLNADKVLDFFNDKYVYMDVYYEELDFGEKKAILNFRSSKQRVDDYVDSNGYKHKIYNLCHINSDGSFQDLRQLGKVTNVNTRQYYAPDYIKNRQCSSKEMNELIRKIQSQGGGDIILGDYDYGVDAVLRQDDGYQTGWHVPFTPAQGQSQTQGVCFILSSGTKIRALSNNMIILRASNNFTRICGTGAFSSGFRNVLHIGFIPNDMNQSQLGSQQFCYVSTNISFSGGYSCVVFQPAASVDGRSSGSYYHSIGFNFYDVNYPVWFKQPLYSDDNLTTTTFLEGIRGHLCISAGKFEACDVHMQNCAFEGMSGEVIDFVTSGSYENILHNSLKISNTDFEVFQAATHISRWGIVLGNNVKFVGGDVAIDEARSPNVQYGKQVFGSYGVVNVKTHVIEHVVGKEDDEKKLSHIMDNNGYTQYSRNCPVTIDITDYKFNFSASFRHKEILIGGDLAGGGEYRQNGTEYGYIVLPSSTELANGGYGYGVWMVEDLPDYKPFYVKDRNHTTKYTVEADGSVLNATGSYGVISDPRTKTNFIDARDYTADFMKLRIGTYHSKVTGNKQIGLLASDLQKVFPSLVDNIGDLTLADGNKIQDCLADKSTPLIYMLVKVVQEQQKKIELLSEKLLSDR
ncbi:Tail fiber protein [Photobacterium piscicola]|uniref:Tail fiber protein n=1 Tax=Photobacterium piscicola TaxID=1378299 RepID=A0A1T5I001_9GAMM|nr:phage tail protein [Photobacterium piscicola]SKC32438.1 Tail fiber protein [Photobacterium piscicola]